MSFVHLVCLPDAIRAILCVQRSKLKCMITLFMDKLAVNMNLSV